MLGIPMIKSDPIGREGHTASGNAEVYGIAPPKRER